MMKPQVILGLAMLLLPGVALASENGEQVHTSVGPGLGVSVPDLRTNPCPPAILFTNDDGTYENGIAWQYVGVVPPAYGAFAEGFHVGGSTVCGLQLKLTSSGGYQDQSLDLYVWRADGANPGIVLGMTPDVHLGSPPAYWPFVSAHDLPMTDTSVASHFFAGYWGNWPGEPAGWYVAADLDGYDGGEPRTNIAPGIGYPTGWTDPSIVFGPTKALGIGVWLSDGGLGACCYPDGACHLAPGDFYCGGSFLGIGTLCSDCGEPPEGACCEEDGSCTVTTWSGCPSGYWQMASPCDPNPCPGLLVGACCTEGVCTLVPEEACSQGRWLGPYATCDPNPCPESPPGSADCTVYSEYAHWVASVALQGYVQDAAVSNGYAYLASDASDLQVIDVTNPRHPRLAASLSTPGRATGVAVSSDHAFLCAGDLLVIDVENPEAPALVATLPTMGDAQSVWAKGGLALVATASPGGLMSVDVSDPQNPLVLASLYLPGDAADIGVVEGVAYVAAGTSGLQIIDISDPHSPWIRGAADTPGEALGVHVTGGLAYVADGSSGVQVIDIADPANPWILGSVDTPDTATDIVVSGEKAVVADTGGGLRFLDLADPSSPRLVGHVGIPGDPQSGSRALRVSVSGSMAYVSAGMSGLHVVDVAGYQSPMVLGAVETQAWGLAVGDDYAYVAGGSTSLQVIEITDPRAPEIVGTLAASGYSEDVAVSSPLAFLVGTYAYPQTGGFLRSVDVSTPSNPQILDELETQGPTRCVALGADWAIAGGYRYGGGGFVTMVDATNPSALQILGGLDLPEEVCDVVVRDSRAYLANSNSGLVVIDLADPSNPVVIGSSAFPGYASTGIDLVGDLACVAEYSGGIRIVDIADPSFPQDLGFAYIPWQSHGIAVFGSHAIVASDRSGFQVVQLEDVRFPYLAGSVCPANWARDVAVANGYIYAADQNGGLFILPLPCQAVDVSEESAPRTSRPLWTSPNPTSGETAIFLDIQSPDLVVASIHDVTGRCVRKLFHGTWNPADHDLIWNGDDDQGRPVAQGAYIARVQIGSELRSARVILLR